MGPFDQARIDDIRQGLPYLIDRVMREPSLYDEDLAAGAGFKSPLSEAPTIYDSASVADRMLEAWTEVGNNTVMKSSTTGNYFCITQTCHVIWATVTCPFLKGAKKPGDYRS